MLGAGPVRREIRPVPDARPRAHVDALVQDGVPDLGQRSHPRLPHHDRIPHRGAFLDHGSREEHGALHDPVHDGSVGEDRGADLGAHADPRRREFGARGEDGPAGILERKRRVRPEQVQVRAIVRIQRADVLPVAVVPEALHVPRSHHRGQDVPSEIVGRVALRVFPKHGVERRGPEHIDPHRDVSRRGRRGLLDKSLNPVLAVQIHNAESARLLPRHLGDRDGRVRAAREMRLDHRPVVHAVDVIPREHEQVLRLALLDPDPVLLDGVRGAPVPVGLRPSLKGLQELHAAALSVQVPGASNSNMVAQAQRAVLREDAHVVDSRVHAVGE